LEYLNENAFSTIGARLHAQSKDLDHYLAAVAQVRTSQDGWFGIKIQPHQIFPFVKGNVAKLATFLASFDRVIFMTRHDKMDQAISGAIARATSVWYNSSHLRQRSTN
jgi:LPS sulfotransferase NodH